MSDRAEVYDAVELGRRIVFCFSIGELRQLADALGVGGSIPWERGIQEAARDLVRQCERYAGLPALVAKLREIRPLVEWPEAAVPVAVAVAPIGFPAAPPRDAPGASTPAPPLPDPFAPPMPYGPPPPMLATAAAAPPAVVRSAPVSAPRPSAVWAGLAAEPAPARGVDPRILVAVAGLMVLAAVIAYLAGRASSGAATAGTATADAPSGTADAPTAARRAEGPATLAADTISKSLANLARVCELPVGTGSNVLVFRRVYDRCGPVPPQPRPAPTPTATPPDPNADAPAEPPSRTRRPGRGTDATPAEPAAPGRGCAGACDSTHRACKAGCGPEPTESSGDEGYRRCLGHCLSDASRCRMSCR